MTTTYSLRAIGAAWATVFDQLEANTISPEEAAGQLAAIAADFQTKVINTGAYILNGEATIVMLRVEELKLRDRRVTLEARMDWLKNNMATEMQAVDGLKVVTDGVIKVALRTGTGSVAITDMAAIPAQYIRQPPAPDPEVDRAAILREWRDKRTDPDDYSPLPPGVTIEKKVSVQVS